MSNGPMPSLRARISSWSRPIAIPTAICLPRSTTARNISAVSVISMSWGSDDNIADQANDQADSTKYLVTPAGHQGITFVASAGDDGVPNFPAESPNVLAVGGTDLYLNSNNTISSETAWEPQKSGGETYSGSGGVSVEFPAATCPTCRTTRASAMPSTIRSMAPAVGSTSAAPAPELRNGRRWSRWPIKAGASSLDHGTNFGCCSMRLPIRAISTTSPSAARNMNRRARATIWRPALAAPSRTIWFRI